MLSNFYDRFASGFLGSDLLEGLIDIVESEYFVDRCLNMMFCKDLGDTLQTLSILINKDEIILLILFSSQLILFTAGNL